MAWHFTSPRGEIWVNVTPDTESRLGARGRLLLVALAWNDETEDERGPGGRRGPASLRYLVFGQGMMQPDWLEPGEVTSMSGAWFS